MKFQEQSWMGQNRQYESYENLDTPGVGAFFVEIMENGVM